MKIKRVILDKRSYWVYNQLNFFNLLNFGIIVSQQLTRVIGKKRHILLVKIATFVYIGQNRR